MEDFRELNRVTLMDRYPLPPLSTFNERVFGCTVFSKIDLRRAYHQVRIASEDQEENNHKHHCWPI